MSKDSSPPSGTVAAVIVRAATEEKPALGVGVVHDKTGNNGKWCLDTAEGYTKNVFSLIQDVLIDGSDGWEKLKEACSDAVEHPEYYPAWNFCLNYAAANGLEGDLAEGWYLPTKDEFNTIYQNITTIDASLSTAGGNKFDDGNKTYMSCTQGPGFSGWAVREAGILDLNEGTYFLSKDTRASVCAVKAFK